MPGLMELLFLLAIWLIVPLGLRFLPDSPSLRLAKKLHPVAALLTTVSFFLPTGPLAAGLALSWLAFIGLMSSGTFFVLKASLRSGVPGILHLAALGFPLVGAVGLVSSRFGYALGGFPEPIVFLTAIHFHYTGFAAPILASLSSRSLLARISGLGLVGGTPLLAAGFIFSPILKVAGVGVLCISVVGIALGQLSLVGTLPDRRAKALLTASSLAVIGGMILAGIYEHGFYTGRAWISISQMAWSHGLVNGVGFSLCGLLAWRIKPL